MAGLVISAVWLVAGVFTLANIANPGDPPIDESMIARPTGTTVTVNPDVPDETTPPAITARDLASKGKTFTLSGHAITESAENEVLTTVDGVRVLLRGTPLGDLAEDDDFDATVTVTGTKANGLPLQPSP
ncbi:hypothetical protein Ato02nite_070120 [Paractinoplanes toevensis]|uniref:Uncharacterized protein n=1 Tax=Paractinoplanes toevensis TaxID=571911 RepID=A0A919TJF4_9ACTN|nr:hypothetical protein Ato02nite_070120 [Actinoplanes toevensis]